ncbi:ATP-binding protein [Rubellimicrobium mesophilum]|nr:ATP-binding protein [Rubellimicrobium mesophilum]
MASTYSASRTRTQNRPGWVLTFRHPLRPDSRGRPGLKMRRGLGTTDPTEADQLVEQMNTLLGDPSWWNATRRVDAERHFAPAVVAAFFDDIQAGRADPWAVREQHIPLPDRDDGFTRVLFVGTTGAGKTTLLRHLIGSDHERDRFPSTSTAKTTVSDIEIVLADGDFEAVVTFSSEHEVQANIEDCVAEACVAAFEGKKDADVADRLLNHKDQRFRLSYALGSFVDEASKAVDDDFSFDEPEETAPAEDEDAVPTDEREKNAQRLRDYIKRVRDLQASVEKKVSDDLGEDISKLVGPDRDAAQDLFESALGDDEGFGSIVHDILDEVRSRFDLLSEGHLVCNRSGWPELWTMTSDNRDEFIRAVRWFASNYAPQFGRLLTPLVDGIRVQGPLFPTFTETKPKLVLLDGQGLGHTPDSSASVTTQITKRFTDVDVVLLVDNAQQPMQAAPLSVIRAVATSGHQRKLAIAFSHFDSVKGANLPDFQSRRAHVMASVTNGLTSLRDALGGSSTVRMMEQTIEDRCFMLGGLDRRSKELPRGFQGELIRLLQHFVRAIEPPPQPVAHPVYHFDGLPLAIQAAARSFQGPWLARLGLAPHGTTSKEHWTRIKALNRRIAGEMSNNEYDNLRPVADLVARLTEEVSRFLSSPASWAPTTPTEAEAEAALDLIREAVNIKFHSLAARRLAQEQLEVWRDAFELKGKGSTFERAQVIRDIYEEAVPVPNAVMTEVSKAFLDEIRQIVGDAVKQQEEVGRAAA